MIIGPDWIPPSLGARKISPDAPSGFGPTVTAGGWKSTCERMCSVGTLATPARGECIEAADPTATGTPVVNEKRRTVDPGSPEAVPALAEANCATTLTRSPGANCRSGTNALPAPAGNRPTWPLCRPLREPLTSTARISEGDSEEKMIWD